jgi:polyisoprenyl-phosphate glycosyltransferase
MQDRPHTDGTATKPIPLVSVIVPCFNEEQVLTMTNSRLTTALGALPDAWEIIYVDDGSRDGTWPLIEAICATDSRIRGLALSRNFGHQRAVSAGIDHARGRTAILIDADLQDPPELIPRMLERWRAGVDVVYGKRVRRKGESPLKLLTASFFYRMLDALSDIRIPLDVGDFRLIDRRVIEALCAMPERDRFLRGMVAWVGFRQEALEYQRDARAAGETKYPLRRMLAFAADGLLSFSVTPLRVATWMGFAASALSLVMITYALWMRLFTSNWVSGWTFLVIAVAFFGGVQLICLGIIGEYVGRTYHEVKSRPLYLLRRDTREQQDVRG